MTNCEKFNAVLNSCQNPRAVYDALFALASTGKLDELRRGGPDMKYYHGTWSYQGRTYAALHEALLVVWP